MTTRAQRRVLGSTALLAIAIGTVSAALPESGPSFVARWGGRTKDLGFGVAADATGIFATGATWSADFPVNAGRPPTGDAWCAFLTQLHRPNGALAQSTVLCGLGMTYGRSVTTDGEGAAWVGGSSGGPGLPVSPNAFQPRYGGGSSGGHGDAIVARWRADGRLDYVSYLGGSGDETAWAVTSDGSGGLWAAGSTTSRPILGRGGSPTGTLRAADGFLAHVTSDGRLAAVKIMGGDDVDELYDVALVDPGRVVVVGATASRDGALGSPRGALDGFMALLDATTLEVLWTLRLGSVRNDVLRAAALVDGRTIVAVGHTEGGACRAHLGDSDGWSISVSLAGELLRNECVGTPTADSLSDVAARSDGTFWVTGTTYAATGRRSGRREPYHRAFVATGRPTSAIGPMRLVSNEISTGYAVATDSSGYVYAIGETTAVPSDAGPWTAALHATAGAFRGSYPAGSTDPYVFAIRP